MVDFVVNAIPTVDGLHYIPSFLRNGGDTPQVIDTFRIGMGGWESSPVGDIPRTPVSPLADSTLLQQNLDIVVDSIRPVKRYASLGTLPKFNGSLIGGYYEGALGPSEQTMVGTSPIQSTLVLKCVFDSTVPVDVPGSYGFWEIGIFTPHPTLSGKMMVAYGTFPKQTWPPTTDITTYVRLSFGSL